MIRHLQRAAVVLGLVLGLASGASAQSTCPSIAYGAVLTAGQWNACFQNKQDALGYIPLAITGGTMTGPLITAVPTTSAAEFNLPPGTAPTSPNNGDVWSTSAGLFIQVNGATVGPLASTSSAVAQTINLNSAALPAKQTGTILQLGQANGVTARVELDAFAAVPRYTCVREDGTAASPTAIQSADELCSLNAFGYNGTAVVGPQAAVRTYAAQNWSVGANGTYLRLGVTPNGSLTLTDALGIEQNGGVTLGSTLGTSAGANTLNLPSLGLYNNGTAPTGTGGGYVLATAPTVSALTVTGSLTATGLVTNADLVNASTTVNGQTCTLGSTCSVVAAASAIQAGVTTMTSGTAYGILTQNSGGTLLEQITTANNGVLVTSSGGVPSISSTLPAAVQSNITALGTVATGVWNGTAIAAAYLPTATSSVPGVVQGDGSTLSISAGVMHCVTSTSSQIGCAKPDGTTIVVTSGVLSAIGAAATSIQVGVTTVGSGNTNYVLTAGAGTLSNVTIASLLTAGTGLGITGTTNATIAVTNPVTATTVTYCDIISTTATTCNNGGSPANGGTFTTPSGAKWLRVRMVGGGGGGAASGVSPGGGTNGGTGGSTTFGSFTAGGGVGGIVTTGGSGGTNSGSPSFQVAGGSGSGGYTVESGSPYATGGSGGASAFGGGGGGGGQAMGQAGAPNSGGGGGGGGCAAGVAGCVAAAGGGAGGYEEVFISSPSSTYVYAIGAAGTNGAPTTDGQYGNLGGAGHIIVEIGFNY